MKGSSIKVLEGCVFQGFYSVGRVWLGWRGKALTVKTSSKVDIQHSPCPAIPKNFVFYLGTEGREPQKLFPGI